MENLRIEYLSINELKPYEKNTRKHQKKDVDNIARSIKKYGMNDAIGIWGKDNVIVEGHGRVMACKQLGIDVIPCVRLDHMTDKQRREYAIAHNATAELSVWDTDFLAEELQDLDLGDFDFKFEFENNEPENEIVEDEFEPVLSDETRSQPGDIWILGNHRLMCGDSTNINDVEKLMGSAKADLLITDPPYNVDYVGKTKDSLKIQNDHMPDSQFRAFLRDAFYAADAVMRPGACFYIWHADLEGYNFRGACSDCGWTVRQCLVWVKNSMVMGRQDYQWKHEPCLYGWKDGAAHKWFSDRKQVTTIEWQKPAKSEIHPTMKPVGLFDYQIKNNTAPGDVVLDLFNGSGTTIMACEQNGRRAFAMELDPKYVDAAIERWEKFTGRTAVRLEE